MNWILRDFSSLTVDELYAVLRLRSEVFVVEQECVFQDMDNKDQMNDAWVAFFPAGSLPARATVGVASLGDGVLIEVSCVATRP